MELLILLIESNKGDLNLLKDITGTTNHVNFTAMALNHRSLSPMPILAENIVTKNQHIKSRSPRTL